MKFLLVALSLSSFSAFSAEVLSAKLDANKKTLLVDVKYGGGCKKHSFDLRLGLCLESYPVQCSAELVHSIEGGYDGCEALKYETVAFNLAKYKLNDAYFAGGTLTISGSKTYDGKATKATVRLP